VQRLALAGGADRNVRTEAEPVGEGDGEERDGEDFCLSDAVSNGQESAPFVYDESGGILAG